MRSAQEGPKKKRTCAVEEGKGGEERERLGGCPSEESERRVVIPGWDSADTER